MAGNAITTQLANVEPAALEAAADELLTIHTAAYERRHASPRARLAHLLFSDIRCNGDREARTQANAAIARALARAVKQSPTVKEDGNHA